MRKLLRNFLRSAWLQRVAGVLAAEYLRLVWLTNRFTFDPVNVYEVVEPEMPFILAFWHGQHFMTPFLRKDRPKHKVKVLISRHHDGDINALAAERLNVGTIRGSGDHGGRFDRKGGVGAFKSMLDALDHGYNVAVTADIPKVSRVCGNGVIKLAAFSGRPMYLVAMATSRRIELDNWDRSAINLPFGRIVIAWDGPMMVPKNADNATVEYYRSAVQERLNSLTTRAYALADGRETQS